MRDSLGSQPSTGSNMRTLLILLLSAILGACASSTPVQTTPSPQTILAPGAPGPTSVPCDTPVVIHATNDRSGVAEERAWLNEHYPGHSKYMQILGKGKQGRPVDILQFQTADGRPISVCFDISASFGHY